MHTITYQSFRAYPFNDVNVKHSVDCQLKMTSREQAKALLLEAYDVYNRNRADNTEDLSHLTENQVPEVERPSTFGTKTKRSIFSFLETSDADAGRKKAKRSQHDEVTKYLESERVTGTDSDALNYWRVSDLPILQEMARNYLSAPATQGAIERLFSISGDIGRARRSSISVATMNTLLLYREHSLLRK